MVRTVVFGGRGQANLLLLVGINGLPLLGTRGLSSERCPVWARRMARSFRPSELPPTASPGGCPHNKGKPLGRGFQRLGQWYLVLV